MQPSKRRSFLTESTKCTTSCACDCQIMSCDVKSKVCESVPFVPVVIICQPIVPVSYVSYTGFSGGCCFGGGQTFGIEDTWQHHGYHHVL